jgi:hypothetical protein
LANFPRLEGLIREVRGQKVILNTAEVAALKSQFAISKKVTSKQGRAIGVKRRIEQ